MMTRTLLTRVGLGVALLACSWLSLTPLAQATMLIARSLPALVQDTDHIVVVTGVGQRSRWDQHGRIVSDMDLRVTEVVKGPLRAGEAIVVTRLGGEIGDLAMTVAGEANVRAGQRAVLFIDNVGDRGAMRVTDMALGQFPIVTHQGVPTVLPSGAGLALVTEGADGSLQPTVAPMQQPLPLNDFLTLLRDLAGAR